MVEKREPRLTRRELLLMFFGSTAGAGFAFLNGRKSGASGAPDFKYRLFIPLVTKELPVNPYRYEVSITPEGFHLNDYLWLAIGTNWRVLDYDNNFGDPPWTTSTIAENREAINSELAKMRVAGIRLVRVGLLDSGAAFFNTGFTNAMKDDVITFLELAYENEIKIEFVLADYLMGARHPEIFADTALRQSITKDLLSRVLTDIQGNPKAKSAVVGFDLLNEPEWLISQSSGGGWEYVTGERPPQPIPLDKVNTYLGEAYDTLKSVLPQKFATVGVSAKHTQVIAGIMDRLDYVAMHHYAYMGSLAQYIDSLPTNKPWVLEEFPTRDEGRAVNPSTYLDLVLSLRNRRSTGALMWMWRPLRGLIDDKTDISMISHLTGWVNLHQNDILSH